MKTKQLIYNGGWDFSSMPSDPADLILAFGQRQQLTAGGYKALRDANPNSTILAGSTSGEISNSAVLDENIVATAVWFDKVKTVSNSVQIEDHASSKEAGKALVDKFDRADLKFLFVISDGQKVNGSELVEGMNEAVNNEIPISGGLAGDGADFQQTVVGLDDHLGEGLIAAIGFYGDSLVYGYGSKGGWSSFGPSRTITKSKDNVLYEIDGTSALDLYKKYLGEYAEQLPGSALLFPLALRADGPDGEEVVRTILTIDQEEKSMTFAGNMPEGSIVRLMKANLDHLVDAAFDAVEHSVSDEVIQGDQLSVLISCVGRKLIFGNRIDEEIEAARETLGNETVISGFYSYGEISPFQALNSCSLHNQTMTVTTIAEK
ncbi:FIST C-terminal domain-containing protein [Cryomorphaceae bacterium]|nr:FIST C-terminal domain-containing protein [Cryomorphaceae bacterium]